jgi:hypothetical protein
MVLYDRGGNMLTVEGYVNFLFIRWIKYQARHNQRHSTVEVYLLTMPHWTFEQSFKKGFVINKRE